MSDLRFIFSLAEFISSANRFPGTPHHLEVRKFLKTSLKGFGYLFTQKFGAALQKPVSGRVEKDFFSFEGLPYTNSPSGKVWGKIADVGFGLPRENLGRSFEGKVILLKEGKLPFRKKEEFFKNKGARGIIVYREEVDEIYAGISAGLLPVISIKPSEARFLHEGDAVGVEVKTKPYEVEGENICLELGEGDRVLYLIAHYDTKPNTPGAIDNGLSVALLVWLAGKLSRFERKLRYRIRFLFTDLEEFGLLGAERFAEGIPQKELKKSIVISVDTVGWRTPAILVRDGEGYNSPSLVEFCAEILEKLGKRESFAFTVGSSGRSDHIPFRKRGARTLFFASNPFPYRHTPLDTFEIVDSFAVKHWMNFLSYFVKNVRWD
ncbi:MAG TPA: M28 family peptidase [Aquifex sp.]|nr:M28 family peptidase [Aquifex sp.]